MSHPSTPDDNQPPPYSAGGDSRPGGDDRPGPAQPGPYGHPGPGQPGQPAGGYGQPAGGYGQPGGYPPPGHGQAPVSRSEETTWAMVAHFVAIVGFFLPGLVVYLVFKDRSAYLRSQGAESLNWGLTMTIVEIAAYILLTITFGILFFLPFLTFVLRLVFGIIAGLAVKDHVDYRYPFNIRFVK